MPNMLPRSRSLLTPLSTSLRAASSVTSQGSVRCYSAPAISVTSTRSNASAPSLSNIEAVWLDLGREERYEVYKQLYELQKKDWKELSTDEKKAGESTMNFLQKISFRRGPARTPTPPSMLASIDAFRFHRGVNFQALAGGPKRECSLTFAFSFVDCHLISTLFDPPTAYYVAFGPHGSRKPLHEPGYGLHVFLGTSGIIAASIGAFLVVRHFGEHKPTLLCYLSTDHGFVAEPPPHTMNKEYQEKMNEYMRSQNMNPIVSPITGFSNRQY